jgi:hypothetical protein
MPRGVKLLAATAMFGCGVFMIPAAAQAKTCFHGYHLDASNHCQPNNPIPMREVCPQGYFPHNAPNRKGYRCKPYP